MREPFVNEWIELIRTLFPKGARIEIDEGDDVVLRIDWKLGNDPDRPNKRTRLIRVIISKETITDCKDVKTAGTRIKKIIQDKLSLFNPDHNTRKYARPPIEEWVLSTFDVN
jgi:hypothetical protein